MRPDPYCEWCGDIETMEHLLCECMHYSHLFWISLGEIITQYFKCSRSHTESRVCSQLYLQRPHLSLLLHIQDKPTRITFLVLIWEIKRDIIYWLVNLPPFARQVTNPQRLTAHLDSTFRRHRFYFQYSPQKVCQCNLNTETNART